MGWYQKVNPLLLLSVVTAGATLVAASILFNGNSFTGSQQNIATAASLPFTADLHVQPEVITGDAILGAPYFRVEPHWMDNFGERHCEECMMVEYSTGAKRTAGAAFAADKNYDFSEAKRAVLFVMGENGGEKVTFGFAGRDLPAEVKIPATKSNLVLERLQFAASTSAITLDNDWQRLEFSLKGTNLNEMKYPLAFQINASDNSKVRFYIGGLFFDTQPIKTPLQYDEIYADN